MPTAEGEGQHSPTKEEQRAKETSEKQDQNNSQKDKGLSLVPSHTKGSS